MKKIVLLIFSLVSIAVHATTYYYDSGNLQSTSSWWTNTDGTGSNPSNFSSSADVFDIQGKAGSVTGAWSVAGTITNSGAAKAITINGSISMTVSGDFSNVGALSIVGLTSSELVLSGSNMTLPIISVPILQLAGTGTHTASDNVTGTNIICSGTNSLDMATHILNTSSISGGGAHVIYTQSTAAIPIPAISYPSIIVVDYNASSGTQFIPSGSTFENLTLSATTVEAGGDFTINGTLTLSTTASLDMKTFAISGTGTINGTGTSTLSTQNISAGPFPENSSFVNLVYNGSGSSQGIPAGTSATTLYIQNGNTVFGEGTISATTIDFQSGSTLDMNDKQLTGTTTITNTSGTNTFRTAYTHATNLPYPDGVDFDNANITVEFYATAIQQIPSGTIYNLNLVGSGEKTLTNSRSLTVGNSGGTLTIDPDTYLTTVSGTSLTLDGCTATLQANASSMGQMQVLGSVSGTYTAHREIYIEASSPRYYNLSTGVIGAALNTLPESGSTIVANSGATGSVWYWNGSNSQWTAPANLTDTQTPLKGFMVFAGSSNGTDFLRSGDGTITAEGNGFVFSTQNQLIEYHDGTGGDSLFSGGATGYGWNLVANPFTAYYDWTQQSFPTNTNSVAYVWTGSTYSSVNTSGVTTNGGSQYIPPAQAFWVQTTAAPGSLFSFNSSNTSPSNSSGFLKTMPEYVKLELYNAQGNRIDDIAIQFEASATAGFDGAFDGHKLPSAQGIPYAYVGMGGKKLSICAAPNTVVDYPIGMVHNQTNSVLQFRLDDSLLTSFSDAILEDTKTGTFTQLARGGTYNFTHTTTDPENRFILHFNNNSIGEEELADASIQVSAIEGDLLIISNNKSIESPVKGEVYNVGGQLVKQFTTSLTQTVQKVELGTLSTGVYLVKLVHGSEIYRNKIIIQ